MKRPYKVRFNLGAGKNYMKWKVEGPDGVAYYDPAEVQIEMVDCQLKNQIKTAKKINEGAHKTVCAWVRCSYLQVHDHVAVAITDRDTQLKYNPRKLPYWFIDEGVNVDNLEVYKVVTQDRKLFYRKLVVWTK